MYTTLFSIKDYIGIVTYCGGSMANNSAITKRIKRISQRIVEDTLENIREEVASQIEEHFELYIERFYDHYPNPVRYVPRTEMTYFASDAYDDFSVSFAKGPDRVGIYVSADNIPGNPYYVPGKYGRRKDGSEVDKDWVFENTFELGRHGYPPYEGMTPMSPSPYSLMSEWFKDFKSNKGKVKDKIKEEALSVAIARNMK
jgi:hypothetical protein